MKRYELASDINDNDIFESPEGDWVRWAVAADLAEALKTIKRAYALSPHLVELCNEALEQAEK